ncbi:G-type lectin S-receptor-like serine/threonine-protein kinase [Populus alba x Populus x berolinensis]|uniref:Receptor-like serine/threonine-protein kinase n=2 Tax=Populus TaxID=3689 RepID=A0AAD6RUG8_9ROSI|nr:G-type lectin S-receptor-like serine/threonine-protein kinase [Populus alba x Populus x berolinensis]
MEITMPPGLINSFTSITMLLVCIFLLFSSLAFAAQDNITSNESIKDGDSTLVSANGTFELGFFSPGNSMNRFLGVWYKNEAHKKVIWVANREIPLKDRSGFLNFTQQGVLLLLNGNNKIIWSSNKTTNVESPVMQLLDTGNLVVQDGKDNNFLWQSFEYPCDTFLPGMVIGGNSQTGVDRNLTSWKSADDPGPGQFSFGIDRQGFPQLVIKNGTLTHCRLGSWNGKRFTGTPDLPTDQFLKYDFILNKTHADYSYEILRPGSLLTRLIVNQSGFVQRFLRSIQNNNWTPIYSAPRDLCDNYSVCGAHMICKMVDQSHNCTCLEGFERKSLTDWSEGCARRSPLNCTQDIFQNFTGLKLPDTSLSWYDTSMSLVECKDKCLKNCSCTAYANSNITGEGSGCILWFGELVDMREFSTGGQDLYIRMPPPLKTDQTTSNTNSGKKKLLGIILGSTVLAGVLTVGLTFYIWRKKQRKQEIEEDMELPSFHLATIVKATDNFSSNNKLGQGGFGPVYKGTLIDGQEIAVKRLSKSSRQGLTEFKNEVILIAKLQHRNLVKLLGCCIQGDERRNLIIGGIARGLLYLHQDSRLRIIHRDLKASNILLDKDMNPKISDFGMARLFGGDQIEADTNKVVGTYGYMPPEYVVDGRFSLKSDVFSFGVLVLELISGKKNRGFSHPDHCHNLLGHAWKLWTEERALELLDNMSDHPYSVAEVLRCIHVGLLCVQQKPEDRPNMSSVVLMLGSENPLPDPKQPGFFTERNMPAVDSSSGNHESSSINDLTISELDAR